MRYLFAAFVIVALFGLSTARSRAETEIEAPPGNALQIPGRVGDHHRAAWESDENTGRDAQPRRLHPNVCVTINQLLVGNLRF